MYAVNTFTAVSISTTDPVKIQREDITYEEIWGATTDTELEKTHESEPVRDRGHEMGHSRTYHWTMRG
jgi:hypothetical protein